MIERNGRWAHLGHTSERIHGSEISKHETSIA
jgi:hypothetical protein